MTPEPVTILVIEDDPDLRELVCAMLVAEGLAVREAATGWHALAILRADVRIDAILSDVILAGVPNGPDVVAKARALRPGLPAVFMSGYTDGALSPDSGFTLLEKPFRRQQLMDALRHAIEGRA